MIKEVTTEVIDKFLNGRDPMERIVNIECGYNDDTVSIIYRDEDGIKRIKKEPFYPFVWCKASIAREMFSRFGSSSKVMLSKEMARRHIGCKGLETKNRNGETIDRMENGYRIMFYAKEPMSFSDFQSFFTDAGTPIYVKYLTKAMQNKGFDGKEFLSVSPVEQHMMRTGQRLFKGYENYDDLVRLIFDIESQGLNPETCGITQMGVRTNKGFQKLYSVEGEGKARQISEVAVINGLYEAIESEKPDIITGHNIENFDIPFQDVRLQKAGTSMKIESSKHMRGGMYKEKKQSVLKLGGETEYYYRTRAFGISIVDSIHAVRRARATDSNMKSVNLKYVTQYSGIAKPNRVYVPGNKIQATWDDVDNQYAFNDTDGDWYIYDPTREIGEVHLDKDIHYFEGVLAADKQVATKTDFINYLVGLTFFENKEGLSGDVLFKTYSSLYDDAKRSADAEMRAKIKQAYETFKTEWNNSHNQYPEGTTAESLLNEYKLEALEQQGLFRKGLEGDKFRIRHYGFVAPGYELVTGRYIVQRYLMDDLWETDKIECRYNECNFLLSKFLPTQFSRVCTMGTAGLWKLIMMAWSYENDLAIPAFGIKTRYTGGLSRLLRVGRVTDCWKEDYNSLYPSEIITNNIKTVLDISDGMILMLEHMLSEREKYKNLKNAAGAIVDSMEEEIKSVNDKEKLAVMKAEILKQKGIKNKNDKKQLPIKIFCNSFFGAYGNPALYPWGDIDCAEETTCRGRQLLRHMIHFFTQRGYTAIVGDTDGFNLSAPAEFRYTEEHPYIGQGLNRNVEKGKAYIGPYGDTAEFNDLYLRGKQGLDCEENIPISCNISRKNYIDYFGTKKDGTDKLKLVGNTLKSKKMPVYIEKFLDKAIGYLIHGNGKAFIEYYYEYLGKIYNYRIPLRDIASRGQIKTTLDEYQASRNELTASGTKKSRQAWYELVLRDGIHVDIGDTVYYINTGTKKGDGDVKRVVHYYSGSGESKEEITKPLNKAWEKYKKEYKANPAAFKENKQFSLMEFSKSHYATDAGFTDIHDEDELIMNCQMIPTSVVDADDDTFCDDNTEYNASKYVDQFNNRIKPLLVCFSRNMRDKILVTDPNNRSYFTDEECVLVSGEPFNPSDQDTYEELMTMDKREVDFWTRVNKRPPFVDEIGMDWDAIVKEHEEIKKREQETIFKTLNEQYLIALEKLKSKEIEEFYQTAILPKRIGDIVHMDVDMHLRFNDLPDMVPSTGGYVFDDIVEPSENDEDEESDE